MARIVRARGLRPKMSLTENIMVMSLMPTKEDVSPEAMVDRSSLGNP